MARLPRIYVEGALYYVTSRGVHNQEIFMTPSDYKDYIDLIAEYKQQFGFKLFSYTLLSTHIHMLIELKNNITISNIIRDINSRYTKIFNRRHTKKGNLFQTRFKAIIAEKETYLLLLIRHMLLDFKRVETTKGPEEFHYSSYIQFLEPTKRQHPNVEEEIEEIFSVLGGREEALSEFISNIDKKGIGELKKIVGKKKFLGSENFVAHIEDIIKETREKQKKKKQFSKRVLALYIAGALAIIFVSIAVINHFYRQSLTLRTEYGKTLALYQRTLEMLKKEQKEALRTRGDIESYQWKIRLAEKALEELKAERKKVIEDEKAIEGYSWVVKLTQIGGLKRQFPDIDTLSFINNALISKNMEQQGFSSPKYSKRQVQGGNVISWEAIQSNSKGETVSWRGKWNGKRMRGVISMRLGSGISMDFSFVSVGERIKK
ncbi:MAG: transposase [Candidatus Omnitrophica bacterium]|nr:transposase [Candidatus Omnitrophota bacterium]